MVTEMFTEKKNIFSVNLKKKNCRKTNRACIKYKSL